MRKMLVMVLFVMLNLVQHRAVAQDSRDWATYYGGNYEEGINAIGSFVATDKSGNVYLASNTASIAGIAFGGFQSIYAGGDYSEGEGDAFLVKFDSSGNRLWATYYGGRYAEQVAGIVVDKWDNIYLAGTTFSDTGISSSGFLNTYAGGGGDAFIVKFNSAGNRLWATYYGGDSDDAGNSITVDTSGNVFLAGNTSSTSGIAFGGYQSTMQNVYPDAFVVKFDSAGNRVWATYYGGTQSDYGYGIATDVSGNVFVTGITYSQSNMASPNYVNTWAGNMDNAFLVKFNQAGNRLWGRYYGGEAVDAGYGLATDSSGNVYLAGKTYSTTGIASGGFQNGYGGGSYSDAFLVKFNPDGNRIWGTYYGSSGYGGEEGFSVCTDRYENVYLAGDSYSTSGIAYGGFQDTLLGTENEYVVKFDKNGARVCATYYGKGHDEGGHVAIDSYGNLYLAGTTSSPTNIAAGGFQNTYGGGGWRDAYLVKFTQAPNPLSSQISHLNPGCNGECNGSATVNPIYGIFPFTYLWSDSQTTQTATALCAGNYSVVVTDSAGSTTTAIVIITEPDTISVIVNTINLCHGDSGTATAISTGGTPGYNYLWNTNPTQTTITATGLVAGTYIVTVTDANGCSATQSFSMDTIDIPISITQNGDTLSAITAPNYQWYLNDTIIPGATSQYYVMTQSGNYYVVTTSNSCSFTSNIIEASCICVSIEENNFSEKILLYPNPATTQLTISGYTPAYLKLCNTLGQTVAEATNTLPSREGTKGCVIDISSLPQGLYVLQLFDAKGGLVKAEKVVKK